MPRPRARPLQRAAARSTAIPVDGMEARVERLLRARHAPRARRAAQLAATCALEHFTALMAHMLLGDEPRPARRRRPDDGGAVALARRRGERAQGGRLRRLPRGRRRLRWSASASCWRRPSSSGRKVLEHQVRLMRHDGILLLAARVARAGEVPVGGPRQLVRISLLPPGFHPRPTPRPLDVGFHPMTRRRHRRHRLRRPGHGHPAQAGRDRRLRASWSRPTASAAPGATTTTRAAPATSRRTSTRSRSSPTRAGRACSRRSRRSSPTCERCADKYGLRPHIRFAHEVPRAAFDEATARWTVQHRRRRARFTRATWSSRHRRAQPARATRSSPGLARFAGEAVPLGALGPRLRPRRQDASRSSAPAPAPSSSCRRSRRAWRSCTSSSARRRGSCRKPDRAITPRRAAAVRAPRRCCSGSIATASTGRTSARARLRRRSAADAAAWQRWRVRHLRASRCPTRRCASEADAALHAWAASASSSPTTTTRRWRAPNVEVVTERHPRGHARAASSPPTASSAASTRIVFGTGFHVAESARAHAGARARRRRARRGVAAAAPRRYLGTTVAGFPNLLHARRPQHRPRPQLDGLHDRVAGRATSCAACARAAERGARCVDVRAGRAGAPTTSSCSAARATRCGRRAAELVPRRRAATTPRCGPASPSSSGCAPAASTRPTTNWNSSGARP